MNIAFNTYRLPSIRRTKLSFGQENEDITPLQQARAKADKGEIEEGAKLLVIEFDKAYLNNNPEKIFNAAKDLIGYCKLEEPNNSWEIEKTARRAISLSPAARVGLMLKDRIYQSYKCVKHLYNDEGRREKFDNAMKYVTYENCINRTC